MTNINSEVFSLFSVISYRNYKCSLCPSSHEGIKGSVANLKKHFSRLHKSSAESIGIDQENPRKRASTEPDVRVTKTIHLDVDINQLRRGLVLQIIGANRSFRSFDDVGFKLAFGDFFNALGMTMNREEIRKLIRYSATEVRKMIVKDLKVKMLCLMYDSAKRMNKSVLGVKAQYLDGNEIKVVGLGAILMTERQTSANYNSQLNKLLENVEKSVDHIYASVTDTAAVMLKSSRTICDAQEHFYTFELFLEDDSSLVSHSLLQDDIFMFLKSSDADIDDYDNHLEIDLGTLCSVVHCGVHVIQLCASDVSGGCKQELDKIRTFVKECKKAEHADLFRASQLNLPKLDTEPRWDTKFSMCSSVQSQKEGLKKFEHHKLQLDDSLWDFLANYVASFHPIYLATKEFQRKSLTIGRKQTFLFNLFFIICYFSLGDFYQG